MLIQIKDGVPFGHSVLESNFRALFPLEQLPNNLTAADVEPLGFGLYEQLDKPEVSMLESVEEGPVVYTDGVWQKTWVVKTLEGVYRDNVEATLAEEVREKRDALFATSVDRLNPIRWNAMSSETQQAWSAYRQALLDLTDQAGFPFEVTWPTKPE